MTLPGNNAGTVKLQDIIRPPAVSGFFYPDEPSELKQTVSAYLRDTEPEVSPPKALIVPHAGYIYSGPIAARAYASLKPVRNRISRVVLLGPAHRVRLQGIALSSAASFATPLGNIEIDKPAVEKIGQLNQVAIMDAAHEKEHSLEVHLPFLQVSLAAFTLVPLVVGNATPGQVAEVLELLWGGDETLIVISSDLSHYHDYDTARQTDSRTSAAIQRCELEKIGPHQACGCMPMRGLLQIAKRSRMEINILDVRNSGDTAGTKDRVVGYGAYSFHDRSAYPARQKQLMTAMARQSIESGLKSGQPLAVDKDDFDPALQEPMATFVTLKINGRLRGCIGTLRAVSPLIESVADNARKAAFNDPRFSPLTADEYEKASLTISILSPPAAIRFESEQDLLEQLRPGVDGLIIEKGSHKATFLPAVWETLPTARAFLEQLKLKAGMAASDMPAKAWHYTTESF